VLPLAVAGIGPVKGPNKTVGLILAVGDVIGASAVDHMVASQVFDVVAGAGEVVGEVAGTGEVVGVAVGVEMVGVAVGVEVVGEVAG
jgi:hypothetical protein